MNNADIDYKDGLDDGRMEAWECARKLCQSEKYGGLEEHCAEIFNRQDTFDVFDYSASEAIAKIKEYEEESQISDKWINLKEVIKVLTKNRVHFYDMVKITSELKELPSVNPVPSGDLINRQAALDAFGLSEKTRKYGGDHSGYDTVMKYEIQDVLEDLPPVTPRPKTGHWIDEVDDYGEIQGWHCSECYEDTGFTTNCKWDFCPSCGARMEGEAE